ncbi:MBL fold metallo-hydrolase [Alkalihalobacillus sp. BA299]|uniref:MBL fold metallo-hydrolase n=1 Tax=Alkalihalobacillus sp. BA299 TaxID=2815938 RepID=UPI001ADCE5B0|nr:MBL fold metallo-hydrolase [Alkalihalobacillus sp. BA299]
METLIIKTFSLGQLQTNCYVVTDINETFCMIVDPGEEPDDVIEYVRDKKVDFIFLTHCHHDHIAGLNKIKQHTNAPVAVHHTEAMWLTTPSLNLSEKQETPIICNWPDILLNGEEMLKCGPYLLKVIHTPGHSPGSTSYLLENYLFSGDTLLNGLIGPTEIPFGNRNQIKTSVKEILFQLDESIQVYPGHGHTTTIGHEKKYNLLPNLKVFHS